ncbi:MAG: alpha/beta hydrolase [Desulfobacteraceae bacterium]
MQKPDSEIAVLRDQILAFYDLDIERHFCDAGGIRTFYLRAGSGHPLVMLHGAGGCGVFWAPVIGRLSRHFSVIVPDVVGYGESDKPDGRYDRPYFVHWLRAFLDAVAVEKAGLVGNSQGGAIAIQFAIDNPHRVSHLVPVCAAGLCRGRDLDWGALVNVLIAQIMAPERWTQRLARYLIHDARNFPLDAGIRYFSAVTGMPGGKRAFLNGRGRAVRPFKRRELAKVQCPALILWGAEDRIIKPSAPLMTRRATADATVACMPHCGHTPFIDQPAVFARRVTDFILQKGAYARITGQSV